VPDAAGRAREDLEELRLIGEVHRLLEPAVAEAERIIQLAHRLADALRAVEGTVVDLRVVPARTADDEQLRGGSACELDEGEVPRVSLHRHIEARAEALDEA
jgi:hypothetical protein